MFRKSLAAICLAALLSLGAGSQASAIDFKINGIWTMGFGLGETGLINKRDGHHVNNGDTFAARQRVILGIRAIASESLEGFVGLKLSPQIWGNARTGGALGADGKELKIGQAWLAWSPPDIDLRVKMGLQFISLPQAAGGSSIFDDRVAGITANYMFNENVGLTAVWMRPLNDNYGGGNFKAGTDIGVYSTDPAGYLDNMDLFMLSVPLHFDGFTATPWAMLGMQGRNTPYFDDYYDNMFADGAPAVGATPFLARLEDIDGMNIRNLNRTSKPYGTMFWAGLPITVTDLAGWNIEFDFNYGYVESLGRFDVAKRNDWNDTVRGSMERQGWVAKALVEYKMDWGMPGIFGWYGSGDDDNVKNGSERMPSLCAYGNFTSFMGYGEGMDWEVNWFYRAKSLSYAGTWGIGAFLRDVSFIENVNHLFRVAWWGGTNSPGMVKYMTQSSAWEAPTNRYDSLYLTTNDNLLEFNLITRWDIYENLNCLVDLGYIANFMDNDTWKKDYKNFGTYEKKDAWRAQVLFQYEF